MSGPAYVSDPQVQHLTQLLEEIAKGFIQLPTFQRTFLWTDEKRLELLRSLRDGIPIGSILVWRTGINLPDSMPQGIKRLGPHILPSPPASKAMPRTYLLDGLQRLSTLYGCLRPLLPGTSPFVEDEDGERQSWLVCFDLVDEAFKIAQDEPIPETWLPLTALLDSVRLIQFQRQLAGRTDSELLIRRADALAETFRNYKLPIIPIFSDSLKDATRTFQRVNSQGTRMSELHMVRALTWSETFDLEERLERIRSRLAEVGWEDLDPELIIKTCKAALGLDISVEGPDELSEGLKNNSGILNEITESLIRLARWLGSVGISSPRLISYSYQIVLLAECFRLNPTPDVVLSTRLWRWLWLTTYSGYFASISGYRLKTLLAGVRDLSKGQKLEWPSNKEPTPEFELPKRFDSRDAHVKATAWLLARVSPLTPSSLPINAIEQLARRGPAAMVPIIPLESDIPGVRSIANRTFVSEAGDIRPALLSHSWVLNQQILLSHAIDPAAAQALVDRDYPRFLNLRKACIERLERQFFDGLPNA